MNHDHDKALEARIDRELKALRYLEAPDALLGRVMAAIEKPALLPWYRQAWPMWPIPLRVVSFVILAGVFCGLCVGGWELSHGAGAVAIHEAGRWFPGASALWDAVRALAEALVLVVRKLGTGFMVACIVAATFSYFACIGLGTALVRFGFARR